MAAVFPARQTIVVGGGLAGMSAANQTIELGGCTTLLDKSSFCGGNSTKATSGINGAGTKTQKEKGIPDNPDIFLKDTLKGGSKRPEIASVLCLNSGDDVNWLMDKFELDLSLLARLGGHSQPRTHRGKERFPGMTITYALIQMCEKVAEKTDRARIVTKAKVNKLITNKNAVIGCYYEKGNETLIEYGPVIFASGGFGADFGAGSLLSLHRPDLLHLPTTNGEHCTGDGIKLGMEIGAATIDLEWVQVHPTGLVKEDDADAKVKFLAAEALRGVGGLVFNKDGRRFANELGRRDYVTGEMWKNAPPFRLCLNEAAAKEIEWHCKHYTGRGVMKYYKSGQELCDAMGIKVDVLVEEHQKHYEAWEKTEIMNKGQVPPKPAQKMTELTIKKGDKSVTSKIEAWDENGNAQWPAYPDGKSYDQASGPTGSGKKFFHNVLPADKVKTQAFYVAIITPVIHYCMGGLEISKEAEVILEKNGKVIPGLYAAGEIAGGVHGANRLGGSSLLDCVVFGRVAAKAACKYIYGDTNKFRPCPVPNSLFELAEKGI